MRCSGHPSPSPARITPRTIWINVRPAVPPSAPQLIRHIAQAEVWPEVMGWGRVLRKRWDAIWSTVENAGAPRNE